jgi:hypothetical protein
MSRTHTEPRVVNFFERKPSRTSFFCYHPITNAWVNIEPNDFDGQNLPLPDQVIRKIPFEVLFEAIGNHWHLMPYTHLLDLVKYMVKIDQVKMGKAIFPIYHKDNPTEKDYADEYMTFPPIQFWITDPRSKREIEIKSFSLPKLTGKSIWEIVYHNAISDEHRKTLFAIYDDNKHTDWGMLYALYRRDATSVQNAILSCMDAMIKELGGTIPSVEITQ